jgi:hypothetical protein
VTSDLGDAQEHLQAAYHDFLKALASQEQQQIDAAACRAAEAWQFFIVRLIERHTAMAASAALALTRLHEQRIRALEQRISALERR